MKEIKCTPGKHVAEAPEYNIEMPHKSVKVGLGPRTEQVPDGPPIFWRVNPFACQCLIVALNEGRDPRGIPLPIPDRIIFPIQVSASVPQYEIQLRRPTYPRPAGDLPESAYCSGCERYFQDRGDAQRGVEKLNGEGYCQLCMGIASLEKAPGESLGQRLHPRFRVQGESALLACLPERGGGRETLRAKLYREFMEAERISAGAMAAMDAFKIGMDETQLKKLEEIRAALEGLIESDEPSGLSGWSGADPKKSLHENLAAFFNHDARRKT